MQCSVPKKQSTEKWMKFITFAYHDESLLMVTTRRRAQVTAPFEKVGFLLVLSWLSGLQGFSLSEVLMRRFIIIRVWGQLQLLWKINSCSEITGEVEVVKIFIGGKNQNCERFHRPEILKQFSYCLDLCCSENGRLHTYFKAYLFIYTPWDIPSKSICYLSRIQCAKLYRPASCVTKSRGD